MLPPRSLLLIHPGSYVSPDLRYIHKEGLYLVSASLSHAFTSHAADILSSTLTGAEIVRQTRKYAVDFNVNIPHETYPFAAGNKRTALSENLMAFSEPQRYRIVRDLCGHPKVVAEDKERAQKLKIQLMTRYGHLDETGGSAEINETLIEQTRHWLDPFPGILALYNQALEKHANELFARNLLDDLRFSLEKLLQELFKNERSLENQISQIGEFLGRRGGSVEFTNMFVKLIDYYAKYQNTYVKHDDAVIGEKVEFVFELTSSFMKHLVRLSGTTNR